ncbi:MAG TPA: M20/M25/M40 family metallo-hydrolase [Herpetosiphonaceae bacterium]
MIKTDRLLDTFLTLVRVDNPSGQEQAMAQTVIGMLRERGLQPEQDAKGNVIARVPGQGEPLLLSAHLDSVAPAVGKNPVVDGDFVRSSGDTVLGADDLAGVTAILEAVTAHLEANNGHRAAEIVFSVEEEVGLNGARALDFSKVSAKQGVALDLNGDVGGICISAPAHEQISVTITGKAAHAGVAPEHGVSAIVVAADAISRMPLGRIDSETTANIGTITGGAARNIVPEHVQIVGEARSRDEAKLDQQVAAMRKAFEEAAERHSAQVDVQTFRAYGAQKISPEAAIVQLCQSAAQRIGLEPKLIETGGGSDVNIFNMHGIEAVNLSVGYQEIHSTNEHIAIADLEKCARLVFALLEV